MNRPRLWKSLVLGVFAVLAAAPARAADDPSFSRVSDVIYGRKYGTALTMDVFTPKRRPTARP